MGAGFASAFGAAAGSGETGFSALGAALGSGSGAASALGAALGLGATTFSTSFSGSGLTVALVAAGFFLADVRVEAPEDFALAGVVLLERDFAVDRLLDD